METRLEATTDTIETIDAMVMAINIDRGRTREKETIGTTRNAVGTVMAENTETLGTGKLAKTGIGTEVGRIGSGGGRGKEEAEETETETDPETDPEINLGLETDASGLETEGGRTETETGVTRAPGDGETETTAHDKPKTDLCSAGGFCCIRTALGLAPAHSKIAVKTPIVGARVLWVAS